MGNLLLLVAVVVWLVVRGRDREETRRVLAAQQEEMERLREMVRGLQAGVGTAAAALVAHEVAGPPSVVEFASPPPPPVAPAVAMAEYLARTRAPLPEVEPAPGLMWAETVPEPPAPPPPLPAAAPARRSLEQTLGTNWLNRLGIALLVFGVALYLAYEVTHLGPLGKVLAGFAVAAVLLGGGLWLERKERYRIFARAGIGGGWALAFLTTYAMYFFPATRVLASQSLDLLLLFAVGVGMVAHSLRYRSQVVTGLAFLLAFSTVTISQVTAFSLLASAVLALGLEWVCVREAWYGLEIAGVVAAYGNHFVWLDRTLTRFGGAGQPFPLWGESTALLLLFWAIFRVGYCVRRPVDEAGEGMSGLAAILNSAGVLGLMKYQSFHPEYAFRALLALGAAEMALAFVMRGRRRPAFAVLVTIASVLLVTAIPFRFGGATWPVVWVLEGEALFLCGVFLRERILRWLGLLTHLLVVGQLLALHGDLVFGTVGVDWKPVAAAFALVAAAMWVNSEGLSRLQGEEGQDEVGGTAYEAVLQVSSCAATLCVCIALRIAVPGWPLALLWAVAAVALMEVGVRGRSLRLRGQGYAVLAVTLVRLTVFNLMGGGQRGFADPRLWTGLGVLAACLLVQERVRRSGEEVAAQERSLVISVTLWCASALVSGLLYLELPERWLAAGWAAFALALAGFALVRDSGRLRSKAVLLVAMALVRALLLNLMPAWDYGSSVNWGRDWGRAAFFTAVALLLGGVPVGFVLRGRPLGEAGPLSPLLRRPEQVFFFAGLILLALWVPADFHHGTLTMAWSLLGVAVFLVALAAGERSFRLAGLGLLLLGVAKLLVVDVWGLAPTERYLLLIGVGVALLLVSFLYSRFTDRIKEYL